MTVTPPQPPADAPPGLPGDPAAPPVVVGVLNERGDGEHRVALVPASVPALVKAGRVAVGFDADAVRLALGEPDRITTPTDAAGDVQVWHYTTYAANGVILFTGTYQSYRRHGFGWDDYWGTPYPYYLDYPDRVIHDRFSVELTDDRVSAIIPERP